MNNEKVTSVQDGEGAARVVLTVRVIESLAAARRAIRRAGATARDVGFAVEGATGATLLIARSVRGLEILRAMLSDGQAASVEDLGRATTCRHVCAAVARPGPPGH